MEDGRPRILIAAPAAIVGQLGQLFQAADTAGAETFEDALARLDELTPDLVIVCYAFDEVRPFRLFHYLRHEWQRENVPRILVRALPIPLGQTQEAQIRESYKTLGVDEFFNLQDEAGRSSRETVLQEFRNAVIRLLPRMPQAQSARAKTG